MKKNRSLSTLTTLSTSKQTSSNLNKSVSSCTPKHSLLHSTRLGIGKTGGIKGALGLTPLTAMFKMQTISTGTSEGKENQSASKSSKFTKSGNKSATRSQSRRRILGILNRKNGSCTTDDIFDNLSFAKDQGIKGYFTRSKSKSSLDSEPSDRMNQTVDDARILAGELASSSDMAMSKESSRSVPSLPTLSREPSPGIQSIDLSLETSIMNTLYPGGTRSALDFPSGEDSPIVSGRNRRSHSQSGDHFNRALSHSERNLRSSANSSSSATLSQTPYDADAFKFLVERLTEHKNLPEDSPQESVQGRSRARAMMNRSYVKMRSQQERSDIPVERKRKQEVRFGEESVIGRPRKARRKSLGAAEGVSELQKRRTVRPLTRSRSLRVWRQKESVEMTGQAGHTPLPRRRRPTSCNERLIM